ncbi:helix-hairpin-helix domain-containing protein [Brevibacillus sp. B_LB10_24]|uniref:helix-hairpin-helix domain-containing protein n=1 Tax=Brevibacillus sp. B_LB10_24 TaxID=3380645 RepID=UPI0038BAB826
MLFLSSGTKLPLTDCEKSKLRKAKVKISEIHTFSKEQIVQMLDVSVERAKILKGLADFQSVPSIGPKLAERLVFKLNIFSLSEIKAKDAGELFDELEKKSGVWIDSCVEDQIRCVINFSNNLDSSKQWFDFTEDRKAYRDKVGFPKNRPIKAWYE